MPVSEWLVTAKEEKDIFKTELLEHRVNFFHILKDAALIPNVLLIRISIWGGFRNQISLESIIDPLGILFSALRMFTHSCFVISMDS